MGRKKLGQWTLWGGNSLPNIVQIAFDHETLCRYDNLKASHHSNCKCTKFLFSYTLWACMLPGWVMLYNIIYIQGENVLPAEHLALPILGLRHVAGGSGFCRPTRTRPGPQQAPPTAAGGSLCKTKLILMMSAEACHDDKNLLLTSQIVTDSVTAFYKSQFWRTRVWGGNTPFPHSVRPPW